MGVRRGTYSIVARDAGTGEMGVAVQSHWFSVGSVVGWGRAGVGVVATQSIPDPAHGTRLLDALEAGASPDEALAGVLEGDEVTDYRQTAVVDAQGRVAVHSGPACIPDAGTTSGDGWSCQANMMASAEVWPAMAEGFAAADGPLPERLVAALRAAEAAGGDVRGRQSAALLVVPADGDAWTRSVDLRVEDHGDPVGELGRLLVLHRAYALAGEADELTGAGRHDEAGVLYERAAALVPGNGELVFWSGLSRAGAGDLAAGVEQVRRAFALNPNLPGLLERLGPDVAPAAPAVRDALA
jgi:uncharacterized Ntn-hydrolase superfamily protein